MNKRILVGVPPRHHVLLSYDEINGLTGLGYTCRPVLYGRNNYTLNKLSKLAWVMLRALNIVKELYRFSPGILYLNSRFEKDGSTRDFITTLLIKLLYYRKLKIIIKTHGSESNILQSRSFFFSRIVITWLEKNIDAWFFLSQEEKDLVAKYNPRLAAKIYITSNIIDTARSVASANFREKYSLDNNKFKVLFVGRIVREKGVFSLLQSIPMLEFKDKCLFIFVGDGPDLQELMALSKSLRLSEYTSFPGFIPESECDHFYANADILALPTYCNEGFPMALFKSIAVGLPVLTTRIRAARDHLSAPENVLWIDGRSPESIARAITILFNNHDLRTAMSNNNRLLAKKFTREHVCSEMSEVIMSVATTSRRSA
jgi:glycosyltransferase involved in cell wall biosynthesis